MNYPSPSMKNISKLPFPDKLIYSNGSRHVMISTKTGERIGIMHARPEFVDTDEYYPKMKNYWAYNVFGLHAFKRREGVGKAFEKYLRFLANSDEKCEGRIFLRAYNNIDPDHKASSTWWHARGYVGCDSLAEKDLQRHLNHQQTKYGDWYMDMDMYLPIKGKSKK